MNAILMSGAVRAVACEVQHWLIDVHVQALAAHWQHDQHTHTHTHTHSYTKTDINSFFCRNLSLCRAVDQDSQGGLMKIGRFESIRTAESNV